MNHSSWKLAKVSVGGIIITHTRSLHEIIISRSRRMKQLNKLTLIPDDVLIKEQDNIFTKKVLFLFLLRKKTALSFLTPIQKVDQYTTDVPSVVYWCGISPILIHTLVRRGSGGGRRLYPDGWLRKTAWFGNFVTTSLFLGLLS